MPASGADIFSRRPAQTRGLTLIEVLIASVILSVAALAVLELLSRGDSESLDSRRRALASVEAERLLAEASESVKAQRNAERTLQLDSSLSAEALGGCTATIHQQSDMLSLQSTAGTVRMPVVRLVAEIVDPNGEPIVSLERVVPTAAAEVRP